MLPFFLAFILCLSFSISEAAPVDCKMPYNYYDPACKHIPASNAQPPVERPLFDTTVSTTIKGQDTTITISITPRAQNVEYKKEVQSIASSLNVISFLSALSFGLAIATLVVAAIK